jgi:hypothetical protein
MLRRCSGVVKTRPGSLAPGPPPATMGPPDDTHHHGCAARGHSISRCIALGVQSCSCHTAEQNFLTAAENHSEVKREDIVAAPVNILPRIKRNPHVSDSHGFGKIVAVSAGDHKHRNFSTIDLGKVRVKCALAAKDNHCTNIFGRSEIGTDTQFRTYPLKAQYGLCV